MLVPHVRYACDFDLCVAVDVDGVLPFAEGFADRGDGGILGEGGPAVGGGFSAGILGMISMRCNPF